MLLALDHQLEALSGVLDIRITQDHLPMEFLWSGIYELELVNWSGRLLLLGILERNANPESRFLHDLIKQRNLDFRSPDVVLSYDADRRIIFVWRELPAEGGAESMAVAVGDLLGRMDDLCSVLAT